jgi:hypothetical protein
LALIGGIFVGLERERRKKAALRTFAFASLIGCLGAFLGDAYALPGLGISLPHRFPDELAQFAAQPESGNDNLRSIANYRYGWRIVWERAHVHARGRHRDHDRASRVETAAF